MKKTTVISATAAIVFLMVSAAYACWRWVALEELIDEADLVVMGKITSVDKTLEKNRDVGTVRIDRTYKGDGKLRTVEIAFPKKTRPYESTAIFYKMGDEGVWILNKSRTGPFYEATYPNDFQSVRHLDRIFSRLIIMGIPSDGEKAFESVKREKVSENEKKKIRCAVAESDMVLLGHCGRYKQPGCADKYTLSINGHLKGRKAGSTLNPAFDNDKEFRLNKEGVWFLRKAGKKYEKSGYRLFIPVTDYARCDEVIRALAELKKKK